MSRSGRTADLLSELASTIRERATMRLRVEADRAGQRSEAKFVLGFGVAVVVGVVIFGRGTSFLAAYDTATGQLVLALVVAMYGGRDVVAEPAGPLRATGPVPVGGDRHRREPAMMLLALAVSLCFAGGVWLIVSAVWPPRPSLAAALARLHTPGEPRSIIPTTASDRAVVVRAGRWLLRRVRASVLADDRTLADLAVVTRPLEVYAGACALCAIGGVALGPLLWVGAAIGGSQLPVLVPIWFARARRRRRVPRPTGGVARRGGNGSHATSATPCRPTSTCWCCCWRPAKDPEGAMETAARAGNGMAFIELRRATNQARLSGEPVWDTLDDLGRRLDIVELREIAAAGNLAGEQGAAVRRSLMAKARSLRSTSLSAAESQARRRSQSMFLPVVADGRRLHLVPAVPVDHQHPDRLTGSRSRGREPTHERIRDGVHLPVGDVRPVP